MGEVAEEWNRSTKLTTRSRERRLAEVARRQHGVVSLGQLSNLGFSVDQVKHRARLGRLHLLHRGVYAVGHRSLSRLGLWKAATLIAPGLALSHRSAAELWRLVELGGGPIHVTGCRQVRTSGRVISHRAVLPPDELTTRKGIVVTSVARTLLDLAATEGLRPFERALREAEFRQLTDPLGLPQLLERYPRRRGTAIVREALAARTYAKRTRSELEAAFLDFLVDRGIELPETNVIVEAGAERFEVDCLWRAQRVVVELDGRAAHLIPEQVEKDLRRDGLLQSERFAVHRVSPHRMRRDPDGLERQLRAALAGDPA